MVLHFFTYSAHSKMKRLFSNMTASQDNTCYACFVSVLQVHIAPAVAIAFVSMSLLVLRRDIWLPAVASRSHARLSIPWRQASCSSLYMLAVAVQYQIGLCWLTLHSALRQMVSIHAADFLPFCSGNCFAYFKPSVPRDIAIVLMLIHQIVAYGLVSTFFTSSALCNMA